MNQIDLQSRVAVIAGGAHGIGFATAKYVLRSGGAVSLWDQDEAGLHRAWGKLVEFGEVATRTVELTSEAAVRDAANATLGDFCKIDILVNNTRRIGTYAHTWELPLDLWQREIEGALITPFLTCRAILPAMLKAQYGRIVNVVPRAGKEDSPGAHQTASNAGLVALTKALGKEVPQNILVNCVTAATTDNCIRAKERHIDDMLMMASNNRLAGPDEVAATICWLASEDCSVSSGSVFDVCGELMTC